MITKEMHTFLQVVESGSFSKAAKDLYTSVVSVMNHINSLEQSVGVSLFVRTNQGVVLTEAGKSLYEDGEKIAASAAEAIKRARTVAGTGDMTVRIGTSVLRSFYDVLKLWNDIGEETDGIQIELVPFDDTIEGMRSMLASLGKDLDCFVSPFSSAAWKKEYGTLELYRTKCAIAVPKGHALAGKSALTWNDLTGETMLLVKQGESYIIDQIREDILMHHPDIRVKDTPGFYDTAVFNTCNKMGYIMETPDVWAHVHPSLVTIPMEWDYAMPYGLIYAKKPSPIVHRFIDILKRYK